MAVRSYTTKRWRAPSDRPWLGRTEMELLCRDTVIHADIHAYSYADSELWFCITYSRGGTALIAKEYALYTPETLLYGPPDPERAALLRACYWTRASAQAFNASHRALVTRALAEGESVDGGNVVSLHCHYIKVPDANPFPRDMVNSYRVAMSPRTGRPKRPVTKLPDWL